MLRSKYSRIVLGLYFFLLIPSAAILFIDYIIIRTNYDKPMEMGVILLFLFLLWIGLFPLIAIMISYKSLTFENGKLTVISLPGQSRIEKLTNIRYKDYIFFNRGIILSFGDGDQITIGQKEFRNFDEIRKKIESSITVDNSIELKYFNRVTKLWTIAGVAITILLIVIMKTRP